MRYEQQLYDLSISRSHWRRLGARAVVAIDRNRQGLSTPDPDSVLVPPTPRPRVLLIPDGIPLDYSIQLANSISSDADVMLLVANDAELPELDEQLSHVDPQVSLCLSDPVSSPPFRPGNWLAMLRVAARVRKFRPSIIHVQNGDMTSVGLSTLFRRAKLATTIHSVDLNTAKLTLSGRLVQRYFLARSARVFVLSGILKASLAKTHPDVAAKTVTITMGEMNTAPMLSYLRRDICEETAVLFYGSIGERKGLEYLIEAEPTILGLAPDAKIIIAGKVGPPTSYLDRCMSRTRSREHYELHLGYVSWKETAELFQRSALVVLPYVEGTTSAVVGVAYRLKKPVVVTSVAGLPEVVEHGKTGLVVPPRNPQALGEAIGLLLRDGRLRREMGENGYAKLTSDMAWHRISRDILASYP